MVVRFVRLPPPEIFANYLGDVKLMVQEGRRTEGTLEDLGWPPRVSIRRRMVRMLVEMATQDVPFDRWYIFAHSLGTVVAHNGLNETALCLANYLDEDTWNKAMKGKLTCQVAAGNGADKKNMMPARPTWLGDLHAIDRAALFKNFRGFVTYGSPLDKFSALWPWIVGTNDPTIIGGTKCNDPVFGNCDWINLYDLTDPVAGKLDDYGTPGKDNAVLAPVNIAVEAHPVLLWSHIRYFKYKKNGANNLANSAATWLLDGNNENFIYALRKGEPPARRRKWRAASKYSQWLITQILFAMSLGWVIGSLDKINHDFTRWIAKSAGHIMKLTTWVPVAMQQYVGWWVLGTVVSCGVVLIAGVLLRLKRRVWQNA